MKNTAFRQSLRFKQWVLLTFIIVMCIALAYDAWRAKTTLNSAIATLDKLKLQNVENPEIAKTIRDLDFLYRATLFQTRDRQNYGFLLIGIAFIAFAGTMALELALFKPQLEIPKPGKADEQREKRQAIIYAASATIVLCAAVAVLRIGTRSPEAPRATETQLPKTHADLAAALSEEARHWPQFRGSVLQNLNKLPPKWDFTPKWRAQIPLRGFSSPIVWGNVVLATGADSEARCIFAFDAGTGKELWRTKSPISPIIPDVQEDTGLAAPTPCANAEAVFAVFATGEVIACRHDGTLLWNKQLPAPDIMYGYASSPLLLGDKIIIQWDQNESQTIFALDTGKGNAVWETKRDAAQSWASPTALLNGKNATIFTVGCKGAEAFDAETGRLLWSQNCLGGEVATSPVARDNTLFFSNTGAFTGAFSAADGKILFQNDNVPAPDVASPLLLDGILMLFTSGGSVLGVDARTGAEVFEETFDNGFYASPVALEWKAVAVNLDGELMLMRPAKDGLVVEGRHALGQKVVATPAFHNGRIIVRTEDNSLILLEAKP